MVDELIALFLGKASDNIADGNRFDDDDAAAEADMQGDRSLFISARVIPKSGAYRGNWVSFRVLNLKI